MILETRRWITSRGELTSGFVFVGVGVGPCAAAGPVAGLVAVSDVHHQLGLDGRAVAGGRGGRACRGCSSASHTEHGAA
jgi:hypothetical protein